MRVHRRIKNLTEPEKKQFEEYLEKLDRVLPMIKSHYPDEDTVKVDAVIEKLDKRTVFKMEYVLSLPKKRIVVNQAKHNIPECMDLALDTLEMLLADYFKKQTKDKIIKK